MARRPLAVKFRLAVIMVDVAIIAFFLASPILKNMGWGFYVLDYVIAALLAADLAARAYAYADIKDWLKRPIVWVDLFVLATLLFPAWLFNLGFLRMLRLWTLLNSDFFWRTVGQKFDDTRVEGIVPRHGQSGHLRLCGGPASSMRPSWAIRVSRAMSTPCISRWPP